ncbi:MAG TPA: hypothetical protein VGL72_23915, partial [Bryobacteraceae bacterium]
MKKAAALSDGGVAPGAPPHSHGTNRVLRADCQNSNLAHVLSGQLGFAVRWLSRQSLGGMPSQTRKARPKELGSSKPS